VNSFVRSLREGFRGGHASIVAAVHFYAAAVAFAWLASAPLASALHGALDGHPGAARLAADGGLAVFEELSRTLPELPGTVFATTAPLVLVFLPLALLLLGGAQGVLWGDRARPWRSFWSAGARRFLPLLLRALPGGLYAAAVALLAAGVLRGVEVAVREPSGAGVFWSGAALSAATVFAAIVHARTVLGFAFAIREVRPDERFFHGFLAAVVLSWRRFPGAHAIGGSFLFLGAAVAFLGVYLAGVAGHGTWPSALLAQAGWLGVAWLRAAEIRARIAFAAAEAPAPAIPTAEGDLDLGGSI